MNMNSHIELPADLNSVGLFTPRQAAFIETLRDLRPQLHRYCARMTGSVLDGEDVMQEAVFEAYRKLDVYDESRALMPWLMRIAHNRCIDFLRRRKVRQDAEAIAADPGVVAPVETSGREVDRAVERLIIHLPPKERACVLLKDVFDYSLEDIAVLVDSTVGGVKAALGRGRAKLESLPVAPPAGAVVNAETLELLNLYIDRFNRRDWDGVRALTSADARLRVTDCFAGRLADSPYFVEYGRPIIPWRMALGAVDGETVIIILRDDTAQAIPFSVIRLEVSGGCVVGITDYIKCAWVLEPAASVTVGTA
ncbi:RNA polymerase sigma factor [Asticcacaulis solisilvae]|uniref:RNA polymerase sigma factor n=1 Tax=Asticcacaulis solisilvae TaxID=1217274 RepID=UPI003FD79564